MLDHLHMFFWIFYYQNLKQLTNGHCMVGRLSNGEDVGRNFITSLQTINSNSSFSVDGKSFVWIYSNTKET